MSLLWLAASVLSGIALLILVPVLLRRHPVAALDRDTVNVGLARDTKAELEADFAAARISEAEYDLALADLKRALLLDVDAVQETGPSTRPTPGTAVVLAVTLPAVAFGLYLVLGTPAAVDPDPVADTASDSAKQGQDMDTLLEQLAARLAEQPDDARGWALLGNALMSTGRYLEAVPAYRRLTELRPTDAEALVRYADALAMAAGGDLSGEPARLIEQALALDPQQIQGLWLAGIAAEKRGQPAVALAYWRRLAPLVANEPESYQEVRRFITRATAATESTAAGTTTSPSAQPGNAIRLQVVVSIDPALATDVKPGDTLFVFAREPGGPAMPVAAVRVAALPLPREVVLDERTASLSDGSLTQYARLKIGARISRSGDAAKHAGDLIGYGAVFDPAIAARVSVLIDRKIP
ncbi:MAG TPA: c-type cytochrome biogenesis protein CcmI [Gammaproteobacteria bacterium]|nr:c-type cytochrome biogenesis protein CcmI [Gammaproteobacteria bacterium]|tara:strand:+ start:5214 stop:6446 length:1233 start_codon:yes stop_codon:yes gene_type:complete